MSEWCHLEIQCIYLHVQIDRFCRFLQIEIIYMTSWSLFSGPTPFGPKSTLKRKEIVP